MKNKILMLSLSATLLLGAISAEAGITTPTANTTLAGTSQTFTWTNSGATAYWLMLGATAGGGGYYNSGQLPSTTTNVTVTGLPVKGSLIHARLYEMVNGAWVTTDTSYNASAVAVASIQNLTSGSTIPGNAPTLTWNNVGADAYYLMIGSTVGGNNLYSSGLLTTGLTAVVAPNLPNDARVIYVRLYTWGNGAWQISDSSYHVALAAVINSHVNAQTLTAGTTQTFSWPASAGSGGYYLDVGDAFNGHGNYFKSGLIPAGTTSVTATGLPTGSVPVKVRLYTWIGNSWQLSDTTYTSAP